MGARQKPERTKSGDRKKKPRVEEINGVLWALDENGNPVKKVKKKAKNGENGPSRNNSSSSADQPYPGFSKKSSKANVKEIDGVLWQLDENGRPVKKLRRKGAPKQEPLSAREQAEMRRRAKSTGPSMRGRRADLNDGGATRRLRAQSVGRPRQQPGEYMDDKGRRVIIEADGNKIVFDKNGKRLRPKKKNVPSPIPSGQPPPSRPAIDNGLDFMKSSIRAEGNFDDLWSDKPVRKNSAAEPTQSSIMASNTAARSAGAPSQVGNAATTDTSELDKKIAEYGQENRDLKSQLMAAQDEVRTLTQQNQKEKAKNIKATTGMLQLKADYQQASDEKHKMDLQVKNLDARLREKEELLEKLEKTPRQAPGTGDSGGAALKGGNDDGGDHLVSQISDLMAENDALLDKLEFEKTASSHEMKKKEEQILFLNEELKKLREENDMLFRGECEKDPLMGRLFQQKKELEEKLHQDKEVMGIRVQGMQEMID
ncbi:MAG: hypothetical protein SGARI_001268, partial [Bacillariaceae sp.]